MIKISPSLTLNRSHEQRNPTMKDLYKEQARVLKRLTKIAKKCETTKEFIMKISRKEARSISSYYRRVKPDLMDANTNAPAFFDFHIQAQKGNFNYVTKEYTEKG